MKPRAVNLFILLFLIFWSPLKHLSATTHLPPLKQWDPIIILEDGRKKPLDTFAKNLLKSLSARSKYAGGSASSWLAKLLLQPERAEEDNIILIENMDVLNAINLTSKKAHSRYNFKQLKASLKRLEQLAFSVSKIKPGSRSLVESEILVTYNKLYVYQQLAASFTFALPHSDFSIQNNEIKEQLRLPQDRSTFSILEIIGKNPTLKKLKSEINDKEPEALSGVEKKMKSIFSNVSKWLALYRGHPLTIIPYSNGEEEIWLSPWDSLHQSYTQSQPVRRDLYLLADAIQAMQQGESKKFHHFLKSFNQLVHQTINHQPSQAKISLEILYNRINPFYIINFIFGFSLILLLLSFLFAQKWFYRFSLSLYILGLSVHTLGVLARMVIMNRPPATNLYETFIFTAWVCLCLGLILELFKKRNIGLLSGAISGLILLLIAGKYAMEGDTMGMLVAVLDSNFWLAIHVATITIGYAGIVISGIIGHVYVIQSMSKSQNKELLKNTFQAMYATQAFGLIFTVAGTMLGGIWADQSWGRFWGWDPKENGALVIIIWSAILFHARLAKMIKNRGFAYGSIIGTIAIAMAWFGVNLLGVGLHSYGFTSGIATTLFVFVLAELLFTAITMFYFKIAQK